MNIIIFIPFLIYIFSASILNDIWKNNKKMITNRSIDVSIILIGSILCILLNLLVNTGLPLISEWFVNNDATVNNSILEIIIVLITSIIIAPLLEEIFFRYYLYEKIKTKTNNTFSVIVTSILFGIIHFYGIVGLISTIFLGIVLQLIYLKTNSLMNIIIVHSVCNLAIMIVGLMSIPINSITLSVLVVSFSVSLVIFFIKIRGNKIMHMK